MAPPTKCRSRFSCLIGPASKSQSRNFKFLFPLFPASACQDPPKPLTSPVTLRVETGKDIDHRTNTTVSRPGQFRVALHVVVIHRGWLLLKGRRRPSSDRLSAGPATDAPLAQALIEPRQPDVAHAFSVPCRHSWRHSAGIMPAPASVQQTTGQEDPPLAAAFALLLRAAVEVQSTGARGASYKK